MTNERKQALFALLAAVGIVGCLVALVFVSLKTHKYTLTFVSEGSTVAEEEVTTDTIYSSKYKPQKQDYVFVGWTLDVEENEIFDFASNPITSPNTFYAVYEPLVAAETLFYDREVQEVELGGTSKLYVSATPSGFNNDIYYESADESIATVDEYGVVTAHKAGSTTIKAYSGEVSSVITVSVLDAPTGLSVKAEENLKVAEVIQLSPVITPSTAAHNYVFTSSDTTVVTVDQFGRLTGVDEGTATITVSVGKQTAACVVTVTRPQPSKIEFEETSIILNLTSEEQKVKQLVYEVLPLGANQKVEFETANPVVATVDENGLVTAKSVGETYIIARTSNHLEFKISVKVARTASAITKTQSKFGVWVGASYTLENYLEFNPASAKASYTLTWAVTRGAANLSVDSATGKITGIAPSTEPARVTVTAVSVTDTQTITFDIYVNGGVFEFEKPQGNYLYFVSGGGGNTIDLTGRVSWTLFEYGVKYKQYINCSDYSIKTSSNLKLKTGNLLYLASNPSSQQDVTLELTKTHQNHTYTTPEWTIHIEPELCVKKVDGRSTTAKPVEVEIPFGYEEVEILLSLVPYSITGSGVNCTHGEGSNYTLSLTGETGTVTIVSAAGQELVLTVTKAIE